LTSNTPRRRRRAASNGGCGGHATTYTEQSSAGHEGLRSILTSANNQELRANIAQPCQSPQTVRALCPSSGQLSRQVGGEPQAAIASADPRGVQRPASALARPNGMKASTENVNPSRSPDPRHGQPSRSLGDHILKVRRAGNFSGVVRGGGAQYPRHLDTVADTTYAKDLLLRANGDRYRDKLRLAGQQLRGETHDSVSFRLAVWRDR